jgi:hypothetical protein
MAPLLAVMGSVNAQLKAMDKALEQQAKTHEVAKRLCTAAGVGPVTAITFVATIARVERFAHGLTGLRFDEASASRQSPWRESSPASCLRCGAMAPTSDKPRLPQPMLHNPRQSRRTNTYVSPR